MGLGVEVGTWYLRQQAMQTWADTIADSVAGRAGTGAQLPELQGLAQQVLRESQFPIDTELSMNLDVRLVNQSDPDEGIRVDVSLSRTVERLFTRFFQEDDVVLSANAAAVVRQATPGCVLALARAGANVFQLQNSASVKLVGCEALSNSLDDRAFFVPAGNMLTADCARTAGHFLTQGQLTVTCHNGFQQEAGFTVDPYAHLQEPGNYQCTKLAKYEVDATNPMPAALQRGPDGRDVRRFCGGLTISANTTLQPGLYIISGGQLNIPSGTVVTGMDVTFYLGPAATSVIDRAVLQLAAPRVGDYPGILFFGPRAVNTTLTQNISAGAGSTLEGAVYMPGSTLSFRAAGTLNGCMQIIGNVVRLNGVWTLNSSWQNPDACPGQSSIVASNVVRLVQ
jgi:hypothetical protein